MARVLIVDDDPDLVEACCIVLESAGYDIQRRSDGAGVTDAVARFGADLVLLDWVMPNLSGDRVLEELRRGPNAGVPVLMMSALHGAAGKAYALGADGFLAKPFGAEELVAAVKGVLDHARRAGSANS